MKKFSYILFDLDGTLSDPKEGITKSFQYALKHFGIKLDNLDELEPVIGPPLKSSFMNFYHLNEKDAVVAIEKYRERFGKIGLYENEIYPGIKELLQDLVKRGYQIAIASSKPTEYVEQICEYFQIKEYFHHIIGSFMDGRRVEKEEVVEEAIAQFGTISKDEIVMVGDRKFDVIGAHDRGLKAIGVTYGYGGREELTEAGADYLVDNVEELRKILLQYNESEKPN